MHLCIYLWSFIEWELYGTVCFFVITVIPGANFIEIVDLILK